MSTITEVQSAIENSIQCNQIVHIPHNQDIIDILIQRADDLVSGNDEIEFWGEDDGQSWRVHVRKI